MPSVTEFHETEAEKPAGSTGPLVVADLSNLRILGDRFVFDVCSGSFHRISETAAFILAELKQKTLFETIITRYADRYGISRAGAERDVGLFLNDLSATSLPASHSSRAQ